MYIELKSVVGKLKGGKPVELHIKAPLAFLEGDTPHMVECHLYCDYDRSGLRSLLHMAGQDLTAKVIDHECGVGDEGEDFVAYMIDPEIVQLATHENDDDGEYLIVHLQYRNIQLAKP